MTRPIEIGHVDNVQASGLAISDGATQEGMVVVATAIAFAGEILRFGSSGREIDQGINRRWFEW